MTHATFKLFGRNVASYIFGRSPQYLCKMGIVRPFVAHFPFNKAGEDCFGFTQFFGGPCAVIRIQILPIRS